MFHFKTNLCFNQVRVPGDTYTLSFPAHVATGYWPCHKYNKKWMKLKPIMIIIFKNITNSLKHIWQRKILWPESSNNNKIDPWLHNNYFFLLSPFDMQVPCAHNSSPPPMTMILSWLALKTNNHFVHLRTDAAAHTVVNKICVKNCSLCLRKL